MNLQYLSDNLGHTTAVLIPIDEWNMLKEKYTGIAQEENNTNTPDWHIELALEELKNIENGTSELTDGEEVKKEFNL